MCRLSILIPWWNEASSFEDTLVSVLENRPGDSEILVVHPERYDDPYGLRDEVRFIQCSASSELELINTGFHRAEGDIVHLVRCGVLATPKWTDSAVEHFESDFVGAVAPLIAGDGTESTASGWNLTRQGRRQRRREGSQTNTCSSPALDAGFFRRQPILDLGGFDLDIGHVPELELGLALAQLGFDCFADDHSVLVRSRLVRSRLVRERSSQAEELDDSFGLAESLAVLHWRNQGQSASWLAAVTHCASLASDLLRGRVATFRGRISGWRNHDRESYRARIGQVVQRMEERAQVLSFPTNDYDSFEEQVDQRRAA